MRPPHRTGKVEAAALTALHDSLGLGAESQGVKRQRLSDSQPTSLSQKNCSALPDNSRQLLTRRLVSKYIPRPNPGRLALGFSTPSRVVRPFALQLLLYTKNREATHAP